jgi:riboflavin synthase
VTDKEGTRVFTGLVQAIGEVVSLRRRGEGARLALRAPLPGGPLEDGESVAVDGACLTVTGKVRGGFEADLSQETLARTTAGSWRTKRRVNLERSLTPQTRMGGHFVQGHVDGRGRVHSMIRGSGQVTLRVETPAPLRHLIVEKGSIAVDGVSLTVSALGRTWFEAALVPHTLKATNLSDRRPGDAVNLEVDLIARYLEGLLASRGIRRGR